MQISPNLPFDNSGNTAEDSQIRSLETKFHLILSENSALSNLESNLADLNSEVFSHLSSNISLRGRVGQFEKMTYMDDKIKTLLKICDNLKHVPNITNEDKANLIRTFNQKGLSEEEAACWPDIKTLFESLPEELRDAKSLDACRSLLIKATHGRIRAELISQVKEFNIEDRFNFLMTLASLVDTTLAAPTAGNQSAAQAIAGALTTSSSSGELGAPRGGGGLLSAASEGAGLLGALSGSGELGAPGGGGGLLGAASAGAGLLGAPSGSGEFGALGGGGGSLAASEGAGLLGAASGSDELRTSLEHNRAAPSESANFATSASKADLSQIGELGNWSSERALFQMIRETSSKDRMQFIGDLKSVLGNVTGSNAQVLRLFTNLPSDARNKSNLESCKRLLGKATPKLRALLLISLQTLPQSKRGAFVSFLDSSVKNIRENFEEICESFIHSLIKLPEENWDNFKALVSPLIGRSDDSSVKYTILLFGMLPPEAQDEGHLEACKKIMEKTHFLEREGAILAFKNVSPTEISDFIEMIDHSFMTRLELSDECLSTAIQVFSKIPKKEWGAFLELTASRLKQDDPVSSNAVKLFAKLPSEMRDQRKLEFCENLLRSIPDNSVLNTLPEFLGAFPPDLWQLFVENSKRLLEEIGPEAVEMLGSLPPNQWEGFLRAMTPTTSRMLKEKGDSFLGIGGRMDILKQFVKLNPSERNEKSLLKLLQTGK